MIVLPKTEFNYWNDEEVAQIGKIGQMSQSFEEDGKMVGKNFFTNLSEVFMETNNLN